MSEGEGLTALLLAGKRNGALDALAAGDNVSHKCLVKVAGRTMIGYPLEALSKTPGVGRIMISIDEPEVLAGVAEVEALRGEGRLHLVEARRNLVDSLAAAAGAADFPVLITTADNVLMSPEAVAEFASQARGADAAAAFARRESVLAAHPDGQRKFYRFKGGEYSNCNMYWMGNARALAAAEVFRTGGQFAKHPKRILGAFGWFNLLLFRLGLLSLDGAFARFSRRFRLDIRPVVIADGKVAIDVDNPRTKTVAEEILAREPA